MVASFAYTAKPYVSVYYVVDDFGNMVDIYDEQNFETVLRAIAFTTSDE